MLAVSLAVSLAPIGQAKADSTSEITQTSSITKQVDASRAIEHIRFLSETIGPRPGGTKSEEWASRYVGMQLKSMGYEVEYQPFQVPDQYVGFIESPLSTKRNWQAGAAPNALISTEAVTAPLIFVQGGTKLEDIPNEVNGKIVLFERGTTVADYNKQVENAVTSMGKEVILGAIAATLIILIFLRNFRTTLIAVVSIPLSILLTLFLLHQSNITLNTLTLGGLAVAVGRLVDDSIVVIENIFRRFTKRSFL
ncbi:hypothetical protein CMV37_07735 [Bacillus cereus]|nr:hypothetical protein CMV37_07735 [Bacillus cereus]